MIYDLRFILVDKLLGFCLWLAPEGPEKTVLVVALAAYFNASIRLQGLSVDPPPSQE